MFRPLPRACGVIAALLILATTSLTTANGEGAAANDPVALTPPPVDVAPVKTEPSSEAPAEERETEEASVTAVGAGESAIVDEPADQTAAAQPPSEQQPLGTPNSMFSARPVEQTTETSTAGALAKLDPRQNEFTRVGGALAVVLGLLLLLRTVMKRAGGGMAGGSRPSGVVEILTRYPVARGQSLVVLKMARRVLLVHQNGSTWQTLTEITDRDEVAGVLAKMEAGSRAKDATRFRALLKRFQTEHTQAQLRHGHTSNAASDASVQVVDLTRSQVRGFGSLLGKRRHSA